MGWGRGYARKLFHAGTIAICLLCCIFVYILFAQSSWSHSVDSLRLTLQSGHHIVDQSIANQSTRTKVLLLTYSRSGSSFLGELFNQNSQAFYYFEPLSGIYSYLYGIPFGMASGEYFKYKNGSARYPPTYEALVINQQLNNLLSCDIDRVPVEVLQDRFVMHFVKQKQFKGYMNCLSYSKKPMSLPKQSFKSRRSISAALFRKGITLHNNTHMKVVNGKKLSNIINVPALLIHRDNRSLVQQYTATYQCKYFLNHYCGKYFDGNREFSCFQSIYGVSYPGSGSETVSRNVIDSGQLEGTKDTNKRHILKHNLCVKKSKIASAKCQPALRNKCISSSIVATKVIRLRMEAIGELLQTDPTIKVIHYFRDPRGIENSRSVGMKKKTEGMITDAKMSCSKMMRDIRVRKELEKKHPNSFMVLMYEDLAKYPLETAKSVYRFIGQSMPKSVEKWLKFSTNSKTQKLDKDLLGTRRSNSSATAMKWMDVLGSETKEKLSLICKDVLTELGLY